MNLAGPKQGRHKRADSMVLSNQSGPASHRRSNSGGVGHRRSNSGGGEQAARRVDVWVLDVHVHHVRLELSTAAHGPMVILGCHELELHSSEAEAHAYAWP